MLKALVKKQLKELFRGYFYDARKNRMKTPGETLTRFLWFAAIMAYLGYNFYNLSGSMYGVFIPQSMDWVYFSLMSMIACALGTFGSAFNTFEGMYKAQDNDLLLSLPIPAYRIILSRLTGVAFLSLLYTMVVWLPAAGLYIIRRPAGISQIVMILLMIVILTLLVTVISSALGFLIAVISKRLKNQSVLTAVIAVVLFALYYFVVIRLSDSFDTIYEHSDEVSHFLLRFGNIFVLIGKASAGDVSSFIILTGIVIFMSAILFLILHGTFKGLAQGTASRKRSKALRYGKKRSPFTALVMKETGYFFSDASYMLDCGLSLIILPVLAVLLCVYRTRILELIYALLGDLPGLEGYVVVILSVLICLVMSGNIITMPSVSLEGRSIYLIRSCPVDSRTILNAKMLSGIFINSVPVALSSAVMALSLKLGVFGVLSVLLFTLSFTVFEGVSGMVMGIRNANVGWVTKEVVLRQNFTSFSAFFVYMIMMTAVAGLYILMGAAVPGPVYLAAFSAIMVIASFFLSKWVYGKGKELFEML